MAVLSVATDINAPVAEVFDYVGDQRVYTKWCPGVAMCEMTSTGEVGVGATRNVKMSSTGFSFDWDWVCDEFDRPNKIVRSSDNDPRTKMLDTVTFEEIDGRTRVTHDLDYELSGVLK